MNLRKTQTEPYEVPGQHTSSGDDYIGRSGHWPDRQKNSNDGRDRSKARIIDSYPADDIRSGKIAEQRAINSRGGIQNLDNRRNEIAPRNWKKFGID
jgi:hypothetical protein